MTELTEAEKWYPSLFSDGWKMTRIEGQCIAVREITFIDRVLWWRRIWRKNRFVRKSVKN